MTWVGVTPAKTHLHLRLEGRMRWAELLRSTDSDELISSEHDMSWHRERTAQKTKMTTQTRVAVSLDVPVYSSPSADSPAERVGGRHIHLDAPQLLLLLRSPQPWASCYLEMLVPGVADMAAVAAGRWPELSSHCGAAETQRRQSMGHWAGLQSMLISSVYIAVNTQILTTNLAAPATTVHCIPVHLCSNQHMFGWHK